MSSLNEWISRVEKAKAVLDSDKSLRRTKSLSKALPTEAASRSQKSQVHTASTESPTTVGKKNVLVSDDLVEESGDTMETRDELLNRLLDPILTLEETAIVLNVCPATVRRYTNRGILPHFRTQGNQRRFRLSQVLGFLGSQQSNIEPIASKESHRRVFTLKRPQSIGSYVLSNGSESVPSGDNNRRELVTTLSYKRLTSADN
jgi:excisionase family DNA binding protein